MILKATIKTASGMHYVYGSREEVRNAVADHLVNGGKVESISKLEKR